MRSSMQFAFVSVLAVVSASRSAASSSAVSRATEWLREHEDPDAAGMNDLKASDPMAYGLVEALLTKKSLGLLDPNHMNARFDDAPVKKQKSFSEEAEAHGIEMPVDVPATEVKAATALPYADVSASHHVDMFHFKAADHDDDLVQSITGEAAVAKADADTGSSKPTATLLTSRSHIKLTSVSGNDLTNDAAALGSFFSSRAPVVESFEAAIVEPVAVKQPQRMIQKATPKAAMNQDNAYLNGIDLTNNVEDAVDVTAKAREDMAKSSFHKMFSSFRKPAPAAAAAPIASMSALTSHVDSGALLGDSYAKDLKAARGEKWKRALEAATESASWGGSTEAKPAKTEMLQSDDDDSAESRDNNAAKIDSWLGVKTHQSSTPVVAPSASMAQETSHMALADNNPDLGNWLRRDGNEVAGAKTETHHSALKNPYMVDLSL